MKSRLTTMFAVALASVILLNFGCTRYIASEKKDPNTDQVEFESNDAKVPGETADLSFSDDDPDGFDYDEREIIRRSYPVNPDATLYIHRIEGNLMIETADIDRAEVLLVRSAKRREVLQFQQFIVEHTPESLVVRSVSNQKSIFSSFGSVSEVRHRVHLKLPRSMNVEAHRIYGSLTAGEIEGRVEFRNVYGALKVARTIGPTEVRGVRGEVDVTFAPLNGREIYISGISGNVNLKFEGELNADVDVRAIRGEIVNRIQSGDEKDNEQSDRTARSRRIRFGTGGTEIDIRGINGNLVLSKAGTNLGKLN